MGLVLEEEIEDLAQKLEELQRSYGVGDFEVQNCGNFDKKASILQRRLEKLGGLSSEKCSEQIPDMAESILSINGNRKDRKESFVMGCKNSQTSSKMGNSGIGDSSNANGSPLFKGASFMRNTLQEEMRG